MATSKTAKTKAKTPAPPKQDRAEQIHEALHKALEGCDRAHHLILPLPSGGFVLGVRGFGLIQLEPGDLGL